MTKRRVLAAERHIRNEIRKGGLFAAEVAAEMPTPLERIDGVDAASLENHLYRRSQEAKVWLKGRRLLREVPDADRCLTAWRNSGMPGSASYFVGFLESWTARKAELDRPLTEIEAATLSRLHDIAPEWLKVVSVEWERRLPLYELSTRGLADKRFVDGLLEYRLSPTTNRPTPTA